MSSINLLPKNIKFKAESIKSEKSNFAFVISLLMVLATIVSLAGLYVNNYYALKKIDLLSSEVEAADKKIEKEISNNKFLIAETKAKKNNLLLAKHTYFTKVLDLIKNNLTEDVYLDELFTSKTKEGTIVFELNGIARTYQSVVSQAYIFKNFPNIREVNITSVSIDDQGHEEFGITLEFEERVLFYED